MKPVVKWTEAHFDNETQELTFEVRFTLVDDDISDAALASLAEAMKSKSCFFTFLPITLDGREEPLRVYPYSTARFTLTLDELRAHLLPLAEPDPHDA